jgi:hypothetical protein
MLVGRVDLVPFLCFFRLKAVVALVFAAAITLFVYSRPKSITF